MNMKRILIIFIATFFTSFNAIASDLDIALQQTYMSCMGIDDMLSDMKKIAGINTVVTGVGTVAGGGALVAGIKKHNLLEKLRELEESEDFNPEDTEIHITYNPNFKPTTQSQVKKLGNWRTGLLAVNTATNVAGAIMASKNEHDGILQEKIQSCINTVDKLHPILMQAKMNQEDVTEAESIYTTCSGYKYIDLSVLSKRAKGAKIASVVGGGTGAVGVIVSQVANKSSGDKEKKLDTASNVLAGGATALSGTATVFNALQISAIKKISDVAQQCENLLK